MHVKINVKISEGYCSFLQKDRTISPIYQYIKAGNPEFL